MRCQQVAKPTPQNILYSISASIENDRKKRSTNVYGCHKLPSRPKDRPGKCLVEGCGMVLDMLTYPHAQRHGFESPEEMIAAGMYKPIDFRHVLENEIERG